MKTSIAFMIMALLIAGFLAAQQVQFETVPHALQLYPRNAQDSALVVIAGSVTGTGFDSLITEIFKGDALFERIAVPLSYTDTTASFSVNVWLHAELAEYHFRITVDTVLVATADSVVCGDVYLINGQSNASGIDFDGVSTFRSEWIRAFGTSNPDPSQCAADQTWDQAQARTYYAHAAVGIWGLEIARRIVEQQQVPVCILQGASAGSAISFHLRKNSNPTDRTTNYGRQLYRARKAGLADAAKAMFWYQGEMNTDNSWSSYAADFDKLYKAWKQDYPALGKIYIFQIRPTQGDYYQSQLREVQRKFGDTYPDVALMATNGIPGHDGLHYDHAGYLKIGQLMYRLVARDFYGSTDTLNITPPNIKRIYLSQASNDELTLEFDQAVVWPADSLEYSLRDFCYIEGNDATIDSAFVQNECELVLQLSNATATTWFTYLPNKTYKNGYTIFQGPWLRNPRGVGALSFYHFPIENPAVAVDEPSATQPARFCLLPNYPNPFNPTTLIRYQLPQDASVRLEIFNLMGQSVQILVDEHQTAGQHSVRWNASGQPSGVYFYRLKAGAFDAVSKCILLR